MSAPQTLLTADELDSPRHSFVRTSWFRKAVLLLAVYLLVQLLVQGDVINDYRLMTIATICINVVLATSLNLITGFTGQFSLGHAGFMAIGAYVTALITIQVESGWGLLLGLLAGALLASVVGLLIGLPTLRLRGDYLAIVTLGMAEIIRIILLNLPITNGAAGLPGIPQTGNWTWLFVLTAGSVVLIANYLHSRHGRASVAVREDEIAAESIGVNSTRTKTLSFMVGAFFGGIAGGMYSSYFYFIKPDTFNFMKSVDILVIVVLGGLGSLSASVISAILLAIVSMLLQPFPEIRMILYALILILIMIFRPQGLMGSREPSLKLFPTLIPGHTRRAQERAAAASQEQAS